MRTDGRAGQSRRELAAVLICGLAGACLVLVAMRQGWATIAPAAAVPLAARPVTVSGQALFPAASALAIAAAACLAAVLATRGMLRRVAGCVLAMLGAAAAAAALGRISGAAVRSAAAAIAAGSGGAGAGSVTSGGGTPPGPAAGGPAAGAGPAGHLVITAAGWHACVLAGGVLIVIAGAWTTWRARRLPVMSGRYDSGTGRAPGPDTAAGPAGAGTGAGGATARAGREMTGQRDAASLWESLSHGLDPTDGLDGTQSGRP